LRLFSFGAYGLALAALALVVFGAIECPPNFASKGIQEICTFENEDSHSAHIFTSADF